MNYYKEKNVSVEVRLLNNSYTLGKPITRQTFALEDLEGVVAEWAEEALIDEDV